MVIQLNYSLLMRARLRQNPQLIDLNVAKLRYLFEGNIGIPFYNCTTKKTTFCLSNVGWRVYNRQNMPLSHCKSELGVDLRPD